MGADIQNLLVVTNTKSVTVVVEPPKKLRDKAEEAAEAPQEPPKEKPDTQLAYLRKVHYRGVDQVAQDSERTYGKGEATFTSKNLVTLCCVYRWGQNIRFSPSPADVTCKGCLGRLERIGKEQAEHAEGRAGI